MLLTLLATTVLTPALADPLTPLERLQPPEPCLLGLALPVVEVPAACALEDGAFQTADGGCKDLATDLVWSVSSAYYGDVLDPSMDYEEALSYCDTLVEGGFADWRSPTIEEAAEVHANGAPTHFEFHNDPSGSLWWTETTRGRRAWYIKYGDIGSEEEVTSVALKTSQFLTLCVRDPAAVPPPPVDVDVVVPDQMDAGTSVTLTIFGGPFVDGATVSFEDGTGSAPSVDAVTFVDAATLEASVSVSGGGKPGARLWDLRVTNPDGGTGELVQGFTVVK